MDSCNNVTRCWLPGSEIIPNKSWLLKSHMAHVRCAKFLKVHRLGHSTFQPLDNSSNQHIYSELLLDNNIDALHNLGVHPIRYQFWQFRLCNVYRLWQPDELHQLLLGLVKDILHWQLK